MQKIIMLWIIVLSLAILVADVPETINFQGAIKDANGLPVNTSLDLTFRIYDTETGGVPLWEETLVAVSVDDGIFNVELGNSVAFPPDLLDYPELWITFRVSGEVNEMSPRERILSVPYSRQSENSNHAILSDTTNTISGVPISGLVQQDTLGNVSISGTMTANAFVGDGSGLTGITAIYDSSYINTVGPDTMESTGGLPTLTINNNGIGDGLRINSTGNDGININNVPTDGIHISSADDNGIQIEHSGNFAVRIDSTGNDGIYIRKAGNPSVIHSEAEISGLEIAGSQGYGIAIGQSDKDGIFIYKVGNPSGTYYNTTKNGIEIQGTEGTGVYIGRTDSDGFFVSYTQNAGFGVHDAGTYGYYVYNCSSHGLIVNSADGDGINVNTTDTSGEYGVYTPDKIYGSNLTSRTINTIGRNTGSEPLEPGDVVCLAGGYQSNVLNDDENIPIINVEKLNKHNNHAVVGVVEYAVHIREETENIKETGETIVQKSFRYKEGDAYQNDYVSIVVFGPADVKINSKDYISVGETLTSHKGNVEKVKTTQINGITIAENTNIIGKALENSNGKGKMKVFVNCK